jgi:hypothetical protein
MAYQRPVVVPFPTGGDAQIIAAPQPGRGVWRLRLKRGQTPLVQVEETGALLFDPNALRNLGLSLLVDDEEVTHE